MRSFLLCLVLFLHVYPLAGASTFKLVETWNPGDEVVGRVGESIIDKDGHIVSTFYKTGNRLITPDKIIKFAPYGQGPGDLTDMRALFHYRGDIAYVEQPGKIKVFTKKDGTYKWKETIWLKRGRFYHIIQDGIYYKQMWFLAGLDFLDYDKKTQRQNLCFLKIYDSKGLPIKNLIHRTAAQKHRWYEMNYYVAPYRDKVFFLAENELKVYPVSLKNLELEKEIALEVPAFYKKMPADYYSLSESPGNQNLSLELEHWKTSYSRINKVVVQDGFLVLQVRTCKTNLKRFALLFYRLDHFKLEDTVFTDDLLLGTRAGRYYCFAGGDPGRDEEAEDFKINVYKIINK